MQPDSILRDEAALWAVRTGNPEFDDWEGFTVWLERDPAHAAAYDAAVLAVEDSASSLAAYDLPLAANDEDGAPPAWWQRRWFGPALAACLAALVAVGLWQLPGGETRFETAPGETRIVSLGTGDSVVLAGGSRLAWDEAAPRAARLEAGQALFRIRHDEAAPFRLVAGRDVLVDAGTTFDVRLAKARLDVEVAEGAVIVNPDSRNLRLDAGARVTRIGDAYRTGQVDAALVGEWRGGRISFRDATLAEVADDLTRATGLAFAAEPGATAVLNGSVTIAPVKADPASLAGLLGVEVTRRGDSWMLAAD